MGKIYLKYIYLLQNKKTYFVELFLSMYAFECNNVSPVLRTISLYDMAYHNVIYEQLSQNFSNIFLRKVQ